MTTKQKAIVVNEKKEAVVGSIDIAVPTKGQISIKVKAVAINPADWKLVLAVPAGTALGLDGAGVVEKVGDDVKECKVGDRVLFFASKLHAFAEHYVTDSYKVAHMPDELSFADAAALPVAAMTAYVALHDKLRYQHGQSILITAGAGSVGGAAIQMAHHHGLKVIATTSTKNVDAVKKLGCNHVIDYTKSKDIAAEVKEHNGGEGVDLALDCVGPDSANMCLAALSEHGGELATIAGAPTKAITGFSTCQSIHVVSVGYLFFNDKKYHKQQAEFFDHLSSIAKQTAHHKFQARVAVTLKSMEEIPKGIATVKEGRTPGKIVALVDADQGVVKVYVTPEHKKPAHDDKDHKPADKDHKPADKDNKPADKK